jgi:hypothetical protein
MTDDSSQVGKPAVDSVLDVTLNFAAQAEHSSRNFFVEMLFDLVQFLREEKKWWLVPIVLCLALIAVFALLLTTPAAPFIYPGIM